MGGSGDRVWPSASLTLTVNGAQMVFARTGVNAIAPPRDVLTLSGAPNHAREYKVTLKRDGVDPRVETQSRQDARLGPQATELCEITERYPPRPMRHFLDTPTRKDGA